MAVEILPGLSVSETIRAALEDYTAALRKWSVAINLIAPDTAAEAWERHILDSAQLHLAAPQDARLWADLGAGGGLPGIVLAILARELAPERRFVLVESDKRKSAFLLSQIGEHKLNATVKMERTESLTPLGADIVSARALAPLTRLLPWVARHLAPEGMAILPKGRRWATELEEVAAQWQFDCESLPSVIDPESRVLRMTQIRPERSTR